MMGAAARNDTRSGVHIRMVGTGGTLGWPQPGCSCASCRRADVGGRRRTPTRVLVDGSLRVDGAKPVPVRPATPAHVVDALPGGWQITGPDGSRLLVAAAPGTVPAVPDASAPFDAALLDLVGAPTQLGGLRARGLVTDRTLVAACHADHRVPSEAELARRCALWRTRLPSDGDTWHVAPAAGGSAADPADRGGDAGGQRRPWRVLILGGARSGKSEEAELRAAAEGDVTYVATGPAGKLDAEWAARVRAHRERRPPWWRTVVDTNLAAVLRRAHGFVLIDSMTTWLAAVMDVCDAWNRPTAAVGPLSDAVADLVAAWRSTRGHVVAVSDETGLGIVPPTAAGRLFRDELGRLNRVLAAESEEATLVVAGRALPLPG